MTAALLSILALAVGLSAGVAAGRAFTAGRDERELTRAREESANARADAATARTEAAEARTRLAEGETIVARVQARVAKAEAEREAAVARAQEIAEDREAMLAQFKALASETAQRQGEQVNALTSQRLQATEQLLAPVTTSLQQLQARLTEVEKDRATLTAELKGQVRAVRDTGEALRKETAALVTALRKPQVRGSWGESSLRNVVRLAGMVEHCDFDLQVTSRTDDGTLRPDMRVHLAEGKHVFVDSKVPLSAFLDAAEAETEEEKGLHLQRFAGHVRKHVDQLSTKQYWKVGESPEFVVLFLPNEGFFAAALDLMPDLYEYAIGKDVVIATPTTLIGMLRAISYGWKQAALAETAADVFMLGRELYERLGQMGKHFDKVGRALGTAVGAYNDTVGNVESRVLVSARRFRDLKVTEKELAAPAQVEVAVRQLQQPELVEDAAQVEPMIGLRRSDPELFDLVEEDAARTGAAAAPDDARVLDLG